MPQGVTFFIYCQAEAHLTGILPGFFPIQLTNLLAASHTYLLPAFKGSRLPILKEMVILLKKVICMGKKQDYLYSGCLKRFNTDYILRLSRRNCSISIWGLAGLSTTLPWK
jgi:hypothetical protein